MTGVQTCALPISSALLYASSHSDIEAVFVAGKKVVENGHILTIDEENLKKEFSKFVQKVREEI